MHLFKQVQIVVAPCKAIGDIKNAIKEAILDGIIGNNYEEARTYMFKVAEEMGIPPSE